MSTRRLAMDDNRASPAVATRRATEGQERSVAHVVILGGGITGLSAAWHLQQATTRDSLPTTYTLIEQSNRWGGKMRSEVIERDGAPAWVLEAGPDGLLT